MKTVQRKNIITPRRLLALTGYTLLWVYVVLSLPMLAWLNWQPEKDSLANTYPELFTVIVDGEEGYAAVDFCAYGIAWYERDWLGFEVRLPLLKDGHTQNCFVTDRTDYLNHRVDQADEPGYL